jgi:hypothetical protein
MSLAIYNLAKTRLGSFVSQAGQNFKKTNSKAKGMHHQG